MSKYQRFTQPVMQTEFLDSAFSVHRSGILQLPTSPVDAKRLEGCQAVAAALRESERHCCARILFFGGHLIKLGLQQYLIDLLRKGVFTHLATNGAGLIHDFEIATKGSTSEKLPEALHAGHYGTRAGTERLNEIAKIAVVRNAGYGEAVGDWLESSGCIRPSVFKTAYELSVPITVHPLLGADTTHILPNADWGAIGKVAQTDFQIFTEAVSRLRYRGIFVNMGSAVHGPEVFLKALAWVNNAGAVPVRNPTASTAVFDIQPLPDDWKACDEDSTSPLYYFRPWKTLLRRVVRPPGDSWYVQGNLLETVPLLWRCLQTSERKTT